jgi:hypothetical protein
MKRLCFLKFEGLLEDNANYFVDKKKASVFVRNLCDFCSKNNVEVFIVSGFHENVALEKFEESFLKDFFDKEHFVFVEDSHIFSKHETDKKLHEQNLEKDSFFVDSFFKQTFISRMLVEKNCSGNEALLFCNDVWVDGYYTMKFSKIDFVLFENNLLDRNNAVEKINGLKYFSFDSNPKDFFENPLNLNYSFLDKYVFEKMKEVLLKDVDFSKLKEKIGGEKSGN